MDPFSISIRAGGRGGGAIIIIFLGSKFHFPSIVASIEKNGSIFPFRCHYFSGGPSIVASTENNGAIFHFDAILLAGGGGHYDYFLWVQVPVPQYCGFYSRKFKKWIHFPFRFHYFLGRGGGVPLLLLFPWVQVPFSQYCGFYRK